MLEGMRRLGAGASSLHREMKEAADAVGQFLVDAFHFLALFVIGATTVWSAVAAFIVMAAKGSASLADILLLFIYLEIGGDGRYLFQNDTATGSISDLYCNYRSRPRPDRNSRCRASDRNGYTDCSGRNSASVIRCPGAEIWVAQVPVR
jgi:hypothetical protein